MTAPTFEPVAVGAASPLVRGHQLGGISRPQIGIERLPTRRLSNEPRESMNCKSCRKRKIKCNRLRPSCEACSVFQCACIYDAVPKKRGPKTDVLEALLKRVDGLEAQLKEKEKPRPEHVDTPVPDAPPSDVAPSTSTVDEGERSPKPSPADTAPSNEGADLGVYSPSTERAASPPVQADAMLDTYFNRLHAKPFHILDESSLRQRLQLNQVPGYLLNAIYAVAARYTPHPNGHQAAVKQGEDHAIRARGEIDTDEPSIDRLQALLLLVLAFTAAGMCKKAYMLFTNAVGTGMALELHRELDSHARVTSTEREMRRRLFWACYLMDRFMACGSKRPSLIGDKNILLRLPSWSPNSTSLSLEGDFFQSDSNLQYLQGAAKKAQGSSGMLIDICRILGFTNRYLAAGGVKGDSHFPWHNLSNLSKIRQDLDVWASGTDGVFSNLDSLLSHADSTILVLAKLIYHLIHCLVYRPFLPIHLSELAGSGQNQSWQIEATNMCFLHANAIGELVELGRQTTTVEWPSFVGYCICTAGTVHVHGAHYAAKDGGASGDGGEISVFATSADFLAREMQQLGELRYAWASVQHQRDTLQAIYKAHSELVDSMARNPTRFSPVFHLDDFFDRYINLGGPGLRFDAANVSLSDVVTDFTPDSSYAGQDVFGLDVAVSDAAGVERSRRHSVTTTPPRRSDVNGNVPVPHRNPFSPLSSLQTQMSPLATHPEVPAESLGHAAAGFALPPQTMAGAHNMATTLGTNVYSPMYALPQAAHPVYDPMFGGGGGFPSPASWQHGGDNGGRVGQQPVSNSSGAGNPLMGRPNTAPSPGGVSNGGSTVDEKDPFLILLEQLADESNRGPGNELDFFLGMTPSTG